MQVRLIENDVNLDTKEGKLHQVTRTCLSPFLLSYFAPQVDVDENTEAAETYGIEAMPTFKFVKNGEVVETVKGADEASIEAAARQYK